MSATAELAALTPDVVLASGSSTLEALLQATRAVPIVFPIVVDPVGASFVDSLARPGSNASGFMGFEFSLSGKWLELLKQIVPSVTREAPAGRLRLRASRIHRSQASAEARVGWGGLVAVGEQHVDEAGVKDEGDHEEQGKACVTVLLRGHVGWSFPLVTWCAKHRAAPLSVA